MTKEPPPSHHAPCTPSTARSALVRPHRAALSPQMARCARAGCTRYHRCARTMLAWHPSPRSLPSSVALHFAGAPCTLHPAPGWRIAHARAGSDMMSVSAQVCTILRGPTRWTTSAARSGDEVRCDSSLRQLVIEKYAAVIFRAEPGTNVDDSCPCITTALHNSWADHQRVEESRHDTRENPQGKSAECAAQT